MAQPKDRGTSRCIVCGGWLGFHPLRTKEGSICGRVDEKHANFLLDRKMERSYCKIARRRKNTVLMVFILVALFIWVLWLIVFIANFNLTFVGIVLVATALGAAFLWMEFRTAMLGDRMEVMCHRVELDRPVSYETIATGVGPKPFVDPMKAYEETEPARPAPQGLLMYEDMAPTSAVAARRQPVPEAGMPGAPQRIMAPGEWEDMPVGAEGTAAPPPAPAPPPAEAAPAGEPLPAAWTPPPPPPATRGALPPPPSVAVPPQPIEELPEEGARRRAAPPSPSKAKAPPVSALKAPAQRPTVAPRPPSPQPAYEQPAYQRPAYQQPQPAYQQQPQPAYQQQPQPAYQQQPQPAYQQQPQPAYQQPQPAYQQQPQPVYQQQAPAQRPAYAQQPQPAPAYPPQYYQQPPPQQPQQQRPKKVEEEPVVSWEEY